MSTTQLLRRMPLLLLLSTGLLSYGQKPALKDGDRVVFYGDSITAQRLYTRFAEDFALTRYPRLQVTFYNAGVPGDTVNGGYTGDMPTRLKRDLFPRHPTVVTIMLGMNDGYYMPFNQKYLDIYKDGYRNLLDGIRAAVPSARIMLISPTPYDELTHGTEFPQYNGVVSRYAASAKDLAASSLEFTDFFLTVTNLLNAGQQRNPALAQLLVPDRIHPGEAAHWAMAAELARGWGMSPTVSSVRLDAPQAKIITIENATIADLSQKDGTLRWTQTDNALPLPLPLENPMLQLVLESSDLAKMDQQILRIDGLPALQYTLKIDGYTIASFTRERLAAGVNLALFPTPMESQAKEVDGFELKRAQLDEAYFILVIEHPMVAGDAEATTTIEATDTALAEDQRKAAQPLPHHFELLPK